VAAYGQSGVIKGLVLETNGGLALSGAQVTIDSLRRGAITDVNGAFTLGNIPPGTHRLKVSYLTYETNEQLITLGAKEIREVEILMTPIDLRGEEVIITAQALGQTQAINEQLNSDAIANIVSADRIQELPDVNAAEAIARLPGVAINRSGGEGQKVVIRGLEPKFAQITINGVSLPANDAGDRSVDLSLIAPELLDGIEVFKAPLPDMDAEAVGGTVNLKLRKAPQRFKLLAKGLWGYNDLHSDWRDHKGVFQMSSRLFDNKLGVVAQAGLERFNRGGDILQRTWRAERSNDTTDLTELLGNTLRLEDRQEIRRRYNTSLGLDYALGRSEFSLFGLYSRTTRDRFFMEERYSRSDQEIQYTGEDIFGTLDLFSLSLMANHDLGPLKIDWTLSNSRSNGQTPAAVSVNFRDNTSPFTGGNPDDDPITYLDFADPDPEQAVFRSVDVRTSSTLEVTRTATLNFELPYKWGDKIFGSLRFGGKYKAISRERKLDQRGENFYYLGSNEADRALARYALYRDSVPEANAPTTLPQNSLIPNIRSFLREGELDFEGLDGEAIPFSANLDPEQVNHWYRSQDAILNTDRNALVNNYEVDETVTAAYMMLKFRVGEWLTVIPGFRYEYSNNEYRAGLSTVSGRYGVNGFYFDTTTVQQYGEFLPHLHLKVKPTDWFDIRASYTQTLARPDFDWITPRIRVDENGLVVSGGNPNLRHMVSTNYDLVLTAYKGGYGLISATLFSKEIENIFYPFDIVMASDSLAEEFNYPQYRGYELNSYRNSPRARVYGFELDLQTTLSFLPKPLNGLVFNVNYARLLSETQFYFFTQKQVLVIPFPPVFDIIYDNQSRDVSMLSQTPHILRSSLGYDFKGFSARISAIYQSSKISAYSNDPSLDRFDREFWRFDASLKQQFGDNWSVFLNLNNLNNQQDISYTRNQSFLGTIQTYGLTGTLGLQYRIQ